MIKGFVLAVSVILCMTISSVYGNTHTNTKTSEEPIEPPQEILDACLGKQIGDKCTYFDTKLERNFSGVCTKDSRTVFCIADNEPEKKKE